MIGGCVKYEFNDTLLLYRYQNYSIEICVDITMMCIFFVFVFVYSIT